VRWFNSPQVSSALGYHLAKAGEKLPLDLLVRRALINGGKE
jgi:hypothetical protein